MKTVGVVLALIAGLLSAPAASAADGLFAPREGASARDVAPELGVVRARPVSIDLRSLPGADGASALPTRGHALRLDLFDDLAVSARMTRSERLDRGLAWEGRLIDDPMSAVNIVVYDGIVAGSVNGEAGSFRIRWDGTGHVVEEMDYSLFSETADCAMDLPGDLQAAEADLIPPAAFDSGATIDVMIVYTPGARAIEGSSSAMMAKINLAISETNTGYANSGVTQRVRLVHAQEVSFTESGDIQTDLYRLSDPADGFIDNVHTLRNTYDADLVSLFGTGYAYCGVAWLMSGNNPAFESGAFSVVHRSCATGYYSFGHEIGHNQGLNHAHDDPVGTGAYTYSFGHKWPPAPSISYRSVMAYSPGTRVLQFSNPNVSHNGSATGVSNYADNARSLNNTRVTVANWRVGETAQVTVTSPNGGESWPAGSNQTITWTSASISTSASMKLSYTNGAATYAIATLARTATSHSWTVPATTGSGWRVEVCSYVSGACEAQDQSDGTFSITAAVAPEPVRGDMNGDGSSDFVWHRADGRIALWYMNGPNRLSGGPLSPDTLSPAWTLAATADLNGDGKPDFIWQRDDGRLAVWHMNGGARVSGGALTPTVVDRRWRLAAAADINGDGKPDLLWQHENGNLAAWYMNGSVKVGGGALNPGNINTRWRLVDAADLNADGKPDLVWQRDDGNLAVWYMNGLNRVSSASVSPAKVDPKWRLVVATDVNGDGEPDFVWQHSGGSLAVWYMNGATRVGGGPISPGSVNPVWTLVSP